MGELTINLGNFSVLLSLALSLSNITTSLGLCYINSCLIDRTLVCLSGKRLKVAGLWGISKLLDIGVVNLETKLTKLALDVAENALLEFLILILASTLIPKEFGEK